MLTGYGNIPTAVEAVKAGAIDSICQDRAFLFNNVINFVQIFGGNKI